jgi:phosphoribosylamine--glycine ligase
MGAVSPPPFLNKKLKSKIELNIIKPTIQGLKKDNIPFVGFIFFGLIVVKEDPKVIEYNVRMGDPETEVVFPRIKSDFLELIMALDSGNLNSFDLQIDNEPAVTIVLVSGGYPEKYEINKQIFGVENISKTDSYVFHAGAKIENKVLKTSGGRVLAITSKAKSIDLALKKSYDSIKQIQFNKMYYRKDIGFDL